MQRSFSTFARGWAGVGLLVLRAALGIPLVIEGIALLSNWRGTTGLLIGVASASVAAGIGLQVGYSVGPGAIAGGVAVMAIHFSAINETHLNLFSSRVACFLAVSIAVALVFLGPGAFSIDARRFGRREIVIPSRSTES